MADVIDRQTMRALSADTRQEILKLLSKRPHTASELAKQLDKHVTTITEHLAVLEHSGVVRKKDSTNKWVYYVLTDKGQRLFSPHISWMVMMSISAILLFGGLYQVFFVQYQASVFSVGDAAPQMAKTNEALATETTQVLDTNLYIGVFALLTALVFGYHAWLSRRKHNFAKAEMLRALNEK